MSRSTQKQPTELITDPQWRLTRGKYEGETLEDVYLADSKYIEWFCENVQEIHANLLSDLEEQRQIRREGGMKALYEFNSRRRQS